MKVYIIIPAAGSGKRFKSRIPKQFRTINNIPVIAYSFIAFNKVKKADRIIVSCSRKYTGDIIRVIGDHKIKKPLVIKQGGKTRFESVKNAFDSIDGSADDIVIIHDAARPNITHSMVEDIIKECKINDAVIYGLPANETVKLAADKYVSKTIDRSNLWLIQTPQAFKYKVLKDAYQNVKSKYEITDEAMLVEKAGYKIKILKGRRDNIKITDKDDMQIMKKIIQSMS